MSRPRKCANWRTSVQGDQTPSYPTPLPKNRRKAEMNGHADTLLTRVILFGMPIWIVSIITTALAITS